MTRAGVRLYAAECVADRAHSTRRRITTTLSEKLLLGRYVMLINTEFCIYYWVLRHGIGLFRAT